MSSRLCTYVFGCALGAACMSHVAAQTDAALPAAPAVQQGAGEVASLSGGAGEEERTAMAARRNEFPFRVVLSTAGGAYAVAETLRVSSAGGVLVSIRDAGPIVMLKLPPGQYTLEATWQGETQRQQVRVGAAAQELNWRLPG